MSFDSLGLHEVLLQAVKRSGYTEPTAVQAAAIPLAIAGEDLQVSAATGSGKTAAFMLPALQRLTVASPVKSKGPRVLVLTPTRELAQQVTQACTTYGGALPRLRVTSVLGGMPYGPQMRALKDFVDVMIATPGRLIDHMDRGSIDFSRIELLVLDEADRMLDMGFQDDIEKIVSALPDTRQTMLFSATFDGAVGRMVGRVLRNPQKLEVATQRDQHTNIAQHMHYVDNLTHKEALLDHWLRDSTLDQAIVFTGTKREADRLARVLDDQGYPTAALHGDLQQNARTRTLNKLRRGQIRVLVATDVAARGIDVPSITHVINFDLPMQAEDYVHRIGRTGRAGRNGVAITLVSPQERFKLKQIERFTTHKIPVQNVEGLESKYVERPEGDRNFGGGRGNGGGRGRSFGGGNRGNSGHGDRGGFGGKPRSFNNDSRSDSRPSRPAFADGQRAANPNPRGDSRGNPSSFGGGNDFRAPRAERSFGDRPSFGNRPARDSKPFAERSFSDRPSFNDRSNDRGDRPFRDTKSFGDKPNFAAKPGFRSEGNRSFAKPAGAGKPSFGGNRSEGGPRGNTNGNRGRSSGRAGYVGK